MILQNMTPNEKLVQMDKVYPRISAMAEAHMASVFRTLKCAARFPAYVFLPEKEITGMGRWTIVLFAESKSHIKKGLVSYMAFQKFYVTHSRNPMNNGIGIYLLFPCYKGDKECHEYPPHYFARVRQRLIEKRGIVQPDFTALVKEVLRMDCLCMKHIVENSYLIENGLYEEAMECGTIRRDGYENFISYHQCGLSLGISVDKRYFNYTTFVSNDLLRDGQRDLQRMAIREINGYRQELRNDVGAKFNKNAVMDIDV